MPKREPLGKAIALIGGRWRVILLSELFEGPKGFTALQKYLGVTHSVLTADLRKLEQAGIVTRIVHPEKVPMRVIYQLTPEGMELKPIICGLHSLGKKIIERQSESRSV